MKNIEKARIAFADFASKYGPQVAFEGKVIEVDKENYTVDVEIESEVVFFECRLRAIVSENNSIDVLPVVGANVILLRLEDDDYYVISCDKIEEYKIVTGSSSFKMNTDGFSISTGDETMKKLMNEIVDQMLKIYAPKDVPGLTTLKDRINTLLK